MEFKTFYLLISLFRIWLHSRWNF